MSDGPSANNCDPLAGLLTVSATAKALIVSENTVYRLIAKGRLAALKHGRKTLIDPAELDDYVARLRADAARRRELRARATKSATANDRPHAIKLAAG